MAPTILLATWLAFTADTSAASSLGAMPAAAPRGVDRAAAWTVGGGFGWLALTDNLGRDGQPALTLSTRVLARIVGPLMVYGGVELSTTSREDARFFQTAWLAGLQTFIVGRVTIRAGVGPTWVTQRTPSSSDSVGPGWACTVAVGIEAARVGRTAFGMEATATWGIFAKERWDMGGLNMTLTVF